MSGQIKEEYLHDGAGNRGVHAGELGVDTDVGVVDINLTCTYSEGEIDSGGTLALLAHHVSQHCCDMIDMRPQSVKTYDVRATEERDVGVLDVSVGEGGRGNDGSTGEAREEVAAGHTISLHLHRARLSQVVLCFRESGANRATSRLH